MHWRVRNGKVLKCNLAILHLCALCWRLNAGAGPRQVATIRRIMIIIRVYLERKAAFFHASSYAGITLTGARTVCNLNTVQVMGGTA